MPVPLAGMYKYALPPSFLTDTKYLEKHSAHIAIILRQRKDKG